MTKQLLVLTWGPLSLTSHRGGHVGTLANDLGNRTTPWVQIGAMKDVIGIDFGTTYSCIGVHRGGPVKIIANDQGNRITPWVQPGDDERLIGDAAKVVFHTSPSQTVFDAKPLIGCKYDEPEVKRDMKHWPFKIVNKGGKPMIQVKNKNELKDFTPKEIPAMVLTKHQATKDAGIIAGLTILCLCIVNEPVAATIVYGLDKKGGETQIIAYNLGGGTFDVSLLSTDDSGFGDLTTW
ncbi:unnamed protein product [Rhizoctonia solani]|uniref:Uncharacterized protein n=1 Tax=Rhizoctonia solani TaxID=456999 RepID=A0A8H3BIL5_9AGAM|nr:unnamed protein product [Rhizoctonia solani]